MTREEFNNVLRIAVSNEFEHITDDIPKHVFSTGFERRMNRLLRSVEKHKTTPLRVFCKRVVAASLLILIITAAKVNAIGEPVVNFINKICDIYNRAEFEGTVSNTITCEYEPGYIPEGFFLTENLRTSYLAEYQYSNASGDSVKFSQLVTGNITIFMNTENTTVKSLNIEGIEATTLYQSEDITYVQWIQDTYYMRITCRGSSFEETEIIKMIKSVRAATDNADSVSE